MKVMLGICLVILFLTFQWAGAAEFNGEDIDGEVFSGKVFRSDTGRYYNVEIMFEKNEGIIQFDNGQWLIGSLDDEKIKDGTKFSVFDYYSGRSIDFKISGLHPSIPDDDAMIPAII
ncbi:MAG: hypothetical protein ACYDBV_13720 [Nitrospiria bacterium]